MENLPAKFHMIQFTVQLGNITGWMERGDFLLPSQDDKGPTGVLPKSNSMAEKWKMAHT